MEELKRPSIDTICVDFFFRGGISVTAIRRLLIQVWFNCWLFAMSEQVARYPNSSHLNMGYENSSITISCFLDLRLCPGLATWAHKSSRNRYTCNETQYYAGLCFSPRSDFLGCWRCQHAIYEILYKHVRIRVTTRLQYCYFACIGLYVLCTMFTTTCREHSKVCTDLTNLQENVNQMVNVFG